jgi:hypothetical protein
MHSMKTLFAVLLALFTTIAFSADDIRSKVTAGTGVAKLRSLEIDPDVSIYGIPFGTPEDDFIKAIGSPPAGYLRLNGAETAMIYGRAHAFLFENGRLVGLRISSQILDWNLAKELQAWGSYDMMGWELSNGISQQMNLKQVKNLLGAKLMSNEFDRYYYTTVKARVELNFAHYANEPDTDLAHKLHGIYVRQGGKAGADANFRAPRPSFDFPDPPTSERAGKIGIMLGRDSESAELKIVSVIPNSPSDRAGLEKGLLIRSVDQVSTAALSLERSMQLLRGEPGTRLRLEVFDPKANQSRTVELTREKMDRYPAGRKGDPVAGLTNITVSGDQVLKLTATNGARAVIQFVSLTKGADGTGDREDTATYRWRFRATPLAPILAGTNTAVYRYTSEEITPTQFQITPIGSRDEARIKVGNITLDWSYGFTNRGHIRFSSSALHGSVEKDSSFAEGP